MRHSPLNAALCTLRKIVTNSKGLRVIDHFEIKVVAFEECRVFYKNVLEPLGIELKWSDENAAGFGLSSEPNVRFLIEKASVILSAICFFCIKQITSFCVSSSGVIFRW